MSIVHFQVVPYTQEQVLATAVAIGLTTANYTPTTGIGRGQGAQVAWMHLESNDVRFHINGTTPAANCGMIWYAGDYLVLDGYSAIKNFKMINTGGSSSTAVVFYGIE